jgi:glycosyltransferase involved in cell wall biosynthesis
MEIIFSVIIATYNREKYVRLAIDSVLSQTYKKFELIVVDDGSTDGTWAIIRSYGDKIRYLQKKNEGSEATFRKGVSIAIGRYMAFLDSDDYFLPDALASYAAIIEHANNPPVVMGCMQRFRGEERITQISEAAGEIGYYRVKDYFSKTMGMGLAQSIIVMRKDTFEEVNAVIGINGKYIYINDYNLMLQSGMFSPCCVVDHPVTVAYRQHDTQNSLKVDKMSGGVLDLIQMVKRGTCYGGTKRTFDKYAYLAGPILEWTEKSWKTKNVKMAIRLLLDGWPMVLAGILKKSRTRFDKICPIILRNEVYDEKAV